ncbi:MAG TPA: universal stress protein [Acidimicrobiales bacterium]|nr:universal stress protein [Acidimicrobiales bacterium]
MFQKILVAVDESTYAKPVLETAVKMAKAFGAEVRVVHVLETGFVGRAGVVNLESSDEAHKVVSEAVAFFEENGVKASASVRAAMHGRLALEIGEESVAFGAGLVVMGSRGLTDFEGVFVGSTSHRMIHTSKVPVLVVP